MLSRHIAGFLAPATRRIRHVEDRHRNVQADGHVDRRVETGKMDGHVSRHAEPMKKGRHLDKTRWTKNGRLAAPQRKAAVQNVEQTAPTGRERAHPPAQLKWLQPRIWRSLFAEGDSVRFATLCR